MALFVWSMLGPIVVMLVPDIWDSVVKSLCITYEAYSLRAQSIC